jgi:hypothetical protein
MKIIYCEQGSAEWMVARLGIPTASQFDKLLTPKTRKPAAAQKKYRAQIVGEWIMGQVVEWGSDGYMERGKDMEDEARRKYELLKDVDVDQVGFVLRDDELVGASPDGLVGADGGLEIKCPGLVQHMLYLLEIESLGEKFVGQVQGCMYLTGRSWWDVESYHPELPAVIVRVERDEEYLAALLPVLDPFIEQVEADKLKWADHRVPRPWTGG